MGPFNEMRQLERKAQVLALLQRNDLSEWARNFWGTVFDTIAIDEGRYNLEWSHSTKTSTVIKKDISYE
jgi:hypothetical protein